MTEIAPTPPQSVRQTMQLAGFILLCVACMVAVGWWLESHRPKTDLSLEDQPLYGSDDTTRRAALSFNGIMADWYWMRSLQYVGRKVLRNSDEGLAAVQLDDLRSLNLKLLYPLLNRTTTLDPHFLAAYEYGGIVLPAVDPNQAVALLQKGIANNPQEWRLHHQMGYIHWKQKDYIKAGEAYSNGAKLPGAPPWMNAMSARMQATGGSRDTAREIYQRMMQEADDANIRQMAELRLAEVDSFDERDAIRQALRQFQSRANRCPANWGELQSELRAVRLPNGKPLFLNNLGEPTDPSDAPYQLTDNGCNVSLGKKTKLPYQEY
jgi:tetratricopeptide (TPR) repeat protein